MCYIETRKEIHVWIKCFDCLQSTALCESHEMANAIINKMICNHCYGIYLENYHIDGWLFK